MKIKFEDWAKGLCKSGDTIVAEMSEGDAHLLQMAVGIRSEAVEIFDAVKKAVIYGKDIDRGNVVGDLGDLEFYMEGLRRGLSITRGETLVANIAKLGERYEGHTYSDQAARDRADKPY